MGIVGVLGVFFSFIVVLSIFLVLMSIGFVSIFKGSFVVCVLVCIYWVSGVGSSLMGSGGIGLVIGGRGVILF